MTRSDGRKLRSVVQRCVADSGWIYKPVPRTRFGAMGVIRFHRVVSLSSIPIDRIGSLYDRQGVLCSPGVVFKFKRGGTGARTILAI